MRWIALLLLLIVPASSSAKPNFVVILCDDLGYGDLSCYGHPHIKTPNLDQLASEGIHLKACYSSAPVCSSSRAGLLTGRTPSRVGVYDWIPNNHVVHIPQSEVTVATLLKKAGYDTAHIGKWHCNGKFNSPAQPQPDDHGFDHWFSTQNNASPSHANPRNFVRNGKAVGPMKGYSCQLVADEGISWLKSRKKDNPFFMFVCFHEPHEPVASPEDLVKSYADKARNKDEAHYFANVANMDKAVGRLMKTLDDLKLSKDTLVFFTSDNGPETLNRYRSANRSYGSPGPLKAMKLWVYEGGIRVPGILRWPSKIKAGQKSDVPVCGLDVLPTFCELAEVDLPKGRTLDGSSVVPLLEGKKLERKTPLYWHYYRALGIPKAAMRVSDWMILGQRENPKTPGRNVNAQAMKLIKSEKLVKFELYNLREDLAQKTNLAKKHPEKLKELSEKLIAKHREVQEAGKLWEFPKK